MTDTDKAEYENMIRLLTEKLRETVDENDRLRAEVANLTEGANALATLQSLYRNGELPESLRAKCAGLALAHESPPLKPVQQLELQVEGPPEPLADVVARQRARADRMQREARDIEVDRFGAVRILPKPGSDGGNGSDSDH
jgi:hypothetical protein